MWVRADIEADLDKSGTVTQWRMVIFDITTQKETESALEKNEIKYKNIMESVSDPLYLCSPQKTVEYMNPAMVNRVGGDLAGEKCYKAIHGLEKPCEWCHFEGIATGHATETEIESPLDKRTYRVTNMPIVNNDGTISILAIYKDITDHLKALAEKKKKHARLMQAQKTESMGDLAGDMAHDFDDILASIIKHTELALDKVEKGSNLENNLKEIHSSSIRAKTLIMQILTSSVT